LKIFLTIYKEEVQILNLRIGGSKMVHLKRIGIYFLAMLILFTSLPIGVFADNNDPTKNYTPGKSIIDEVIEEEKKEKERNDNKNDSKNNDNMSKHRYDLDTIGLTKDGKPTKENLPKSLTYREMTAIDYNWAGLKIDDQNKGIDRKTGEVKFAPPKTKYDVLVNEPFTDKDGKKGYKSTLYSMFGGHSNFEQYAKGEVEKVDVSYANSYKYINLSGIDGKFNDWTRVNEMGIIKAGSEVYVLDYSEPGLPGHKVNAWDYQLKFQKPDQYADTAKL